VRACQILAIMVLPCPMATIESVLRCAEFVIASVSFCHAGHNIFEHFVLPISGHRISESDIAAQNFSNLPDQN
jgi:hypothetical protein